MVVEWVPCVSHISTIYMYKNTMQKIFYNTMKYNKMNDGIFKFYASTVNISYGFLLRKNYLHGS